APRPAGAGPSAPGSPGGGGQPGGGAGGGGGQHPAPGRGGAGGRAGPLASSRAVTWSSRSGRPGRRAEGGPGSSCTCRQASPTAVSAQNGGAPVSISNSTQPSEYKSACGPAGWPEPRLGQKATNHVTPEPCRLPPKQGRLTGP